MLIIAFIRIYFSVSLSFSLILLFSLCIDSCELTGFMLLRTVKGLLYNYYMNTRSDNITGPYVEISQPKRAILKNDFLLFICVAISAIMLILIGYYVFYLLHIDGAWPQLILFVLLFLYGWWIYKKQLICYRYSIGTSLFCVERTTGKKSRSEAVIHLCDIRSVSQYSDAPGDTVKRTDNFFCGKKSDSVAIYYRVNNEKRLLLVSLSSTGTEHLKKAVKAAK